MAYKEDNFEVKIINLTEILNLVVEKAHKAKTKEQKESLKNDDKLKEFVNHAVDATL